MVVVKPMAIVSPHHMDGDSINVAFQGISHQTWVLKVCSRIFVGDPRCGCFRKIGGKYLPNHPFLIGVSIINHPFWGFSPYFWKHPCSKNILKKCLHTDE